MVDATLEETLSWCFDGSECRLTRPMSVQLSQFWTEATIHSRGFRRYIQSDTKARYFRLWKLVVYYKHNAAQVSESSSFQGDTCQLRRLNSAQRKQANAAQVSESCSMQHKSAKAAQRQLNAAQVGESSTSERKQLNVAQVSECSTSRRGQHK
jgi:hypothetical protein